MGQTLSEPIVDKHTSEGADKRFFYGASAMQGWRISMEDAHTTLLEVGPDGESAFFAVYDGHGGQSAAIFSGKRLHEFIVNTDEYKKGDYSAAIKAGYIAADAALRGEPEMTNDPSGCTAVSTLLTKDGNVHCGNAGDSRCIICSNGRAIALSKDHKPGDDIEFSRITNAGGFVEFGRVNGNLALSRAIGDFEFKNNDTLPPEKQVVTADPDVVKHTISSSDEFLVIACDGIWDCMTNQQVATFVREKVAQGIKLGQICEELMNRCLASESELGGVGCDNMTVVIVGLLDGKTEDEWYAHIKKLYSETDPSTIEDPDAKKGPAGAAGGDDDNDYEDEDEHNLDAMTVEAVKKLIAAEFKKNGGNARVDTASDAPDAEPPTATAAGADAPAGAGSSNKEENESNNA